MPAAATSWFASSQSSASTKTATLSNATSNRRSVDDSSAPSFLDSLNAARPEAKQQDAGKDAAQTPKDQANAQAASVKPKPKSERPTSKKKAAQSEDTDTRNEQAASAESQQQDPEVQPTDEVVAPQADVEAPVEEAVETAQVDPSLMIVTQNPEVQPLDEIVESAEELPPETSVKAEAKKEIHLPWRQYHQKPAIQSEQASETTDNTEAAALAATQADVEAQPEAPVENKTDKAKESAEPVLRAPVSQNNLPTTASGDATSEESGQQEQGQDQQAAGQQRQDASVAKVSKPKAQAAPAPGAQHSPAQSDKTEATQQNVQAVAQAPVAATATAVEAQAAPVVANDRDTATRMDTAATIITDAPVSQDKQGQANAAASAHSAQQSTHESSAETFDQIVLGLRTKIDPKNTKAEIHLNPPELGALKVSVSISDGQLTAEFTAQNQMVRDLLSNNMERLRNVLEGQGVSVDRLAVQTASDAPVASSQSSSQQQDAKNSFDSQHDGRSNGNMGQSQQRMPQRQNAGDFAAMLSQEKPLDMVA